MSKVCNNCGAVNDDSVEFCMTCGNRFNGFTVNSYAPQATVQVDGNAFTSFAPDGNSKSGNAPQKNNRTVLIIIIVLAVLLVAAIALLVITNVIDRDGTPQTTVSTVEEIEETTEIEEPEAEETTEEPTEKETEAPSTKVPTTQPAQDKLYHPADEYYIDPYKAYCYCTDTGVQDYVKMRFGPSKYDYDVVTKLDNNTLITVETRSVDGWTLCDADGTEGWIRTDFIFDTPYSDELEVNFKPWSNSKYTYIGRTDASIGQEIDAGGRIAEEVGIYLYDEYNNYIKSYRHIPGEGVTKVFFMMNDEVGIILEPDTEYHYRIFAVFDGEEYLSGYRKFTTEK